VSVRVIRVGVIPFGLSVLVDEQPDSLVVWLLASEWPQEQAHLLERVLTALHPPQGHPATAMRPGLYAV
jgi:hypothetical protein